MENQILVSVIIPCYNQANYIEETVASVLKSDYPYIEIVIINDGSKDNSEEICLQLAETYSNISYYFQNNAGPSIARNHAIRKSNGDLILPLDGDDLISENYISEAVKVFKKAPRVKVVYCEAEKFGEKTGLWKLKPFTLENLAKDNMIFVSALFKKSDWVACGGYPESLRWVSEDWVFWISMLETGGNVVKLPFVGFYYRISAGSRRKGMTHQKKQHLIDYINTHHKEFIYTHLNGPLRFQRRQSKRYNNLLRFLGLLKLSVINTSIFHFVFW